MSAELSTDESVRLAFSTDASGLHLVPDAVARPTSAAEVEEVLRRASAEGTPVTPAGAQTSYVGGSITDRGVVLSLRAMDRVLDIDPARRIARVEPGALVGDVKRAIAEHGLLFAPDPTSEEECSIGGAIACNASGARSLKYGATRRHVVGLTVALASGEVVSMRRPTLEKNTAGMIPVHDPEDWFVGSEGILGVVLEAELALLPLPELVLGLGMPFPSDADALAFIVAARESRAVAPRCLEFMDERAFAIARASAGLDTWAPSARGYVYAEQESDGEEIPLDAWLALAEAHGAHVDDVQVFDGEAALRDARRMRHAVPATLNERAARYRDAGGRKVSTDWAVPYRHLHEALEISAAIAERHGVPRSVTFGHAGNGHPHQHYLAHDPAELETIEHVVGETLRAALAMGGTVAAEHGIGKLKRRWLGLQMTELQMRAMRAIKAELDPKGILAPGNVL
jgi:FAD/FMN-containing dehydrogenase